MSKPNILFILSDQHRYDSVGYSRDYPVLTPHLDRLSAEGTSFTNAYTPIPLCCPARQSLLAGRRPESFNAFWNADLLPNHELPPTEYTWTKDLQDHGYKNGYVGKWHVNQRHSPLEYGFEDYVSEADYREFRTAEHPEAKFTKGWIGETDSVPLAHTRTHWLADQAISLMKRYAASDQPWHIRLDLPEPHLPCQPHPQFLERYEAREIPEWRSFRDTFLNKPYIQKQMLLNWGMEDYTWQDWEPIVRRYYAIISQLDDAIGTVLDTLSELGLDENTIVIYSADHGDMCGGHRMMDKHYIMYDDVVRVPLIIRYPGIVPAGSRIDSFVYNLLDLPPTLLEWAHLPPRPGFHGTSLTPILNEPPAPGWRTEVVSTYNGQQFGLYNQRMIRSSEFKYIWNLTDIDELYDLRQDPEELLNVIDDPAHAVVLSDLRLKLYRQLKQHGDPLLRLDWLKKQLTEGRKHYASTPSFGLFSEGSQHV